MKKIIKHNGQKGAVLPIITKVIGIAAITILIIWLLLWTKPEPQAKLEQLSPVKVALASVESRTVQPFEEITGRLQPIKSAQVRFEVAGKVESRLVEPGEHVKANDPLMSLDAEDYADQLEQVASELLIEEKGVGRDKELLKLATNNLTLQKQEEQRLERLVGQNLIAQSQLDSTRQRVFDLQAEVARLEYSVATNNARVRMKRAQRDIAKRNLKRTTLFAPFDGIINDVLVDEGDYVNANESALILVDTSELDVLLDVRGEIMSGLTLGQEVDVAINNQIDTGRIVALQPDPDLNTNTHQIRVRIANNDAQSGILAIVTMPLMSRSEAMLIPVSSVLNVFGKSYVFSIDGNVLNQVPVELGRRVGNEFVVLHGLTNGQAIVARDVNALVDQQVVVTE